MSGLNRDQLFEVVPAGLNMRDEAGVHGAVVTVLKQGDIVEKVGVSEREDWWHVRVMIGPLEEEGFLNRAYLKEVDPVIPKKTNWLWFLPDVKATFDRMSAFVGEAAASQYNVSDIPEFHKVIKKYGIPKNTRRFTHFLAQLAHESGHFRKLEESLNYSGEALMRVFPKYFASKDEAQQFHRQKERIANRVYANRIGNGDEASGDGWRYRGRGFIQLTGRANYQKYGEALGVDLLSNPDQLATDRVLALRVACEYWKSNGLNELADKNDLRRITKRINGGFNGLHDRERLLKRAQQIWRV